MGNPGLYPNVDINIPGVLGGEFSYVQLVNGTWSFDTILGTSTSSSGGQYQLDGSDPYTAGGSGPKTITTPVTDMLFSDDPSLEPGSLPFKSFAEINGSFKT